MSDIETDCIAAQLLVCRVTGEVPTRLSASRDVPQVHCASTRKCPANNNANIFHDRPAAAHFIDPGWFHLQPLGNCLGGYPAAKYTDLDGAEQPAGRRAFFPSCVGR